MGYGDSTIKGTSLADVLLEAIDVVAREGGRADVGGLEGGVEYELEADTKVDEADPTFPVIVHVRRRS